MLQPLFSIIVPTYSRSVELTNCLEALALQTITADAFEVIVVDDGSPIRPETTVRRFSNCLDVTLVTAAHAGPAASRNRGAERAAGTFLAFTDDDCRPAPGWLSALKECCTALPDHLVGGRTLNAL